MKRLKLIFICLICVVLLGSCALPEQSPLTVTFRTEYGEDGLTQTVAYGTSAVAPTLPTVEGYTFLGWYVNPERTIKYEFKTIVRYDTTLYALWAENSESYTATFNMPDGTTVVREYKSGDIIAPPHLSAEWLCIGWYSEGAPDKLVDFSAPRYENGVYYPKLMPDYEQIVNAVANNVLTSVVSVTSVSFNDDFSSAYSHGSGVIILEDAKYYYCLTNNHVALGETGNPVQRYVITDCYGVEYKASMVYADPDYDLALLAFSKSDVQKVEAKLTVAKFADYNPAVGDTVIAIGTPEGRINAVTVGSVESYETVRVGGASAQLSNIKFKVVCHTAPTYHGSSGGVLLNSELEIIGINYAASYNDDGSFRHGFAVPLEKVIEFLDSIK